MKPHLFKYNGFWYCQFGRGKSFFGDFSRAPTPQEAWNRLMRLTASLARI